MESELLLKEYIEKAQKLEQGAKRLTKMLQPIMNPSIGKVPKVWNSSEFQSLINQQNLIADIIKDMKVIEEKLKATTHHKVKRV